MATLTPTAGLPLNSAENIESFIRQAIDRGEFQPGQMLGSVKALSEQLQAKRGAVRRALENLAMKRVLVRRPRAGTFINPDLHQESFSEFDPRSRTVTSSRMIALLVSDSCQPDHAIVAQHVQDAAHALNLNVVVNSTYGDRQRCDQIILRLIEGGIGGVILGSPRPGQFSLATLSALEQSKIPVVCYSRSLELPEWPTVRQDHQRGTYLAAQHLFQLKRKNLAYLSYGDREGSLEHRLALRRCGLYRATLEAGLSIDSLKELSISPEGYLTGGWINSEVLRSIVSPWLDVHPEIDAVCCEHDHIAVAVMAMLRERGRRVPDDVAVTGSGGYGPYFDISPGELTSIDFRTADAAKKMLDLLQQQHRGESQDSCQTIWLEPKLTLGRSTLGNAMIGTGATSSETAG